MCAVAKEHQWAAGSTVLEDSKGSGRLSIACRDSKYHAFAGSGVIPALAGAQYSVPEARVKVETHTHKIGTEKTLRVRVDVRRVMMIEHLYATTTDDEPCQRQRRPTVRRDQKDAQHTHTRYKSSNRAWSDTNSTGTMTAVRGPSTIAIAIVILSLSTTADRCQAWLPSWSSPLPCSSTINQSLLNLSFLSRATKSSSSSRLFALPVNEILRQSDESQFGRGEQHLSAAVEEGDVVVYQTGWWLVDGVVVGAPGEEYDESLQPTVAYCQLETIQLVWTHNCEHGLLRGLALDPISSTELALVEPLEEVQFGPEQLLAKLPVEWKEAAKPNTLAESPVPLNNAQWLPDLDEGSS